MSRVFPLTARGLLDELYASTDSADSARIFAGRVESVLALEGTLPVEDRLAEGYCWAMHLVMQTLNGRASEVKP